MMPVSVVARGDRHDQLKTQSQSGRPRRGRAIGKIKHNQPVPAQPNPTQNQVIKFITYEMPVSKAVRGNRWFRQN